MAGGSDPRGSSFPLSLLSNRARGCQRPPANHRPAFPHVCSSRPLRHRLLSRRTSTPATGLTFFFSRSLFRVFCETAASWIRVRPALLGSLLPRRPPSFLVAGTWFDQAASIQRSEDFLGAPADPRYISLLVRSAVSSLLSAFCFLLSPRTPSDASVERACVKRQPLHNHHHLQGASNPRRTPCPSATMASRLLTVPT